MHRIGIPSAHNEKNPLLKIYLLNVPDDAEHYISYFRVFFRSLYLSSVSLPFSLQLLFTDKLM